MKKLKLIKCYLFFETNVIFREKFERERKIILVRRKKVTLAYMESLCYVRITNISTGRKKKQKTNIKTNIFEKKKEIEVWVSQKKNVGAPNRKKHSCERKKKRNTFIWKIHLSDKQFVLPTPEKKKEVEEKTTLFQKVHARYTLLRLALPLFEKRASFSSFE